MKKVNEEYEFFKITDPKESKELFKKIDRALKKVNKRTTKTAKKFLRTIIQRKNKVNKYRKNYFVTKNKKIKINNKRLKNERTNSNHTRNKTSSFIYYYNV